MNSVAQYILSHQRNSILLNCKDSKKSYCLNLAINTQGQIMRRGLGGIYFRIITVLMLVLFMSASASIQSLQAGRRLYEFDGRSLTQMRNLVIHHNISMENLICLNFPGLLNEDFKTKSRFKSELAQLLFHSNHADDFNYSVNEEFMLLSYLK